MKAPGLIVAIVLMLLSGIGIVICLILPGMTRNVSVQESMMVAIPLAGLFFAALVGTVAGCVYLSVKMFNKSLRRTAAMQGFAKEMGFKYEGMVVSPFKYYGNVLLGAGKIPDVPDFHLFSLGRDRTSKQIRDLVTGEIGDAFHVSIFDYAHVAGGKMGHGYNVGGGIKIGYFPEAGGGGRLKVQTVVMLESSQLNLPLFAMRPEPEGFFEQIGEKFRSQDIDFPSNPIFSGKYFLSGEDEQQIRRTFSVRVLSYFENSQSFSTEGGGNRIIIYFAGVSYEAGQLPSMLDEGIKVANLFLDP